MTDPTGNDARTVTNPPMAGVISLLLLVGVGLSAAVLATGLALLLVTGSTGYHEALAPRQLLSPEATAPLPTTIGGVLQGAVALKPFALIELGVLLLIATPVLRVAASVVLFLLERDRLYVAITSLVLAVLLVSILFIGQEA